MHPSNGAGRVLYLWALPGMAITRRHYSLSSVGIYETERGRKDGNEGRRKSGGREEGLVFSIICVHVDPMTIFVMDIFNISPKFLISL